MDSTGRSGDFSVPAPLTWQGFVAGMFIWPQIDDQRQRSLVTAGAQTTNTSEAVYVLTAVSA